MYIGIDLGTSGLKLVLLDETGAIVTTQSVALAVHRPFPEWSEQNPEEWFGALDKAMLALAARSDLSAVRAIGLAGQMHGAVLLDKRGQVLRPAILWNDGRSEVQCRELERLVPQSRQITGNLMMPGFTAPKLKWVAENEPDIFARTAKVLLPKDYLRFCMTGEYASDMSDAAGTMWLDVGNRCWSERMLAACHLDCSHMPRLFEGNEITGTLRAELAARWQLGRVFVVAGGGDNAAGAIGAGVYEPGQAMLSLGTSGVYFVVTDGFLSNPDNAVHSFCHALPGKWHLMSVMLSAASCLDWVQRLSGAGSVGEMIERVENQTRAASPVLFLPYLSGERTPHNDPAAKGAFWGLSHEHGPADLARAVLEGVGFALADGIDALHASGVNPKRITLLGGGARSRYWRQMLADITGQELEYRKGSEDGPAIGAARLAQLAINPRIPHDQLLFAPELEEKHAPRSERHQLYREQRKVFQALYTQLKPLISQ